eukprot:Em0012g661a
MAMDGQDIQFADTLPPLEYVKAPTWTFEQQVQELTRRMMVVNITLKKQLSFSPRPTDVIVATSPKSGTTWVSHICHQIRTKGVEPDFENQIPDVIAMLDFCGRPELNIDPNTMVQPAEPRIYYTHHTYETIPKGGKLIYCFRDQKYAFFSFYPFIDSVWALKGRVSLSVFSELFTNLHWTADNLRGLLGWWEHRHDEDVLFLFFDDLKEDHTRCVRRIAKFIGVECDEETVAHVVHTTTHAEMARHSSKFDFHNLVPFWAKMHGDDPPSEFNGVAVNEIHELSDSFKQLNTVGKLRYEEKLVLYLSHLILFHLVLYLLVLVVCHLGLVLDVAKVVLDVAKVVLDVGKVVLDVAKVVLDVGKVVLDVAKVVLDVAKVVLDVAKVVLDVGKVVLDVAKVVLDVAKVVLDVAKVVLDVGKVVLDVAKVVLDVAKVVLDVAKVVLEVGKVVLDVGKVVLDVGKVVLDMGKVVLDGVQHCHHLRHLPITTAF